MAEHEKKLTAQELLSAPIDSLTDEQLSRRSQIIVLMEQERRLEITNEQNRKFADEKEQAKRKDVENRKNILQQQEEERRVQDACRHKTGGRDRQGFYSGDGDIYGYSVSKERLPTSEIYILCFRCQREWHDPKWWATLPDGTKVFDGRRAVMDGKLAYHIFLKQENEFKTAISWPAKTFEGQSGELPGSIQFVIPSIQKQLAQSAAEFEVWLAKYHKKELQEV